MHKDELFQWTAEERERLLAALRVPLMAREDILFAYVYGSFAEDLPFHDIDVGVYLSSAYERETPWTDVDLAGELESVVRRVQVACQSGSDDKGRRRIPVDVRVLNGAPIAFVYHVLGGKLLFSRSEEVRVSWVAQIVARYLDLKPLRHRALKEAMTSWA